MYSFVGVYSLDRWPAWGAGGLETGEAASWGARTNAERPKSATTLERLNHLAVPRRKTVGLTWEERQMPAPQAVVRRANMERLCQMARPLRKN
eukprot:SAG31_NODE_17466_length_669_cov_1.956140_1_plen_92_part_01